MGKTIEELQVGDKLEYVRAIEGPSAELAAEHLEIGKVYEVVSVDTSLLALISYGIPVVAISVYPDRIEDSKWALTPAYLEENFKVVS